MTEDRPLTPFEIRAWAKRVVDAMTPYERRFVAMALSSFMESDERRAAQPMVVVCSVLPGSAAVPCDNVPPFIARSPAPPRRPTPAVAFQLSHGILR